MESLPVLMHGDAPKEGVWYSLTLKGSAPGVSVGHTCTFTSAGDEDKGRILVVGGANPSGSFSHSHVINLDNYEWETPEWGGLEARYEHCSFMPQSCPQSLWVFGGAHQRGSLNCIQKIQLKDNGAHWNEISINGTPPGPRTYHTNSACIGDKIYVFSGGQARSLPVCDQQLHVFDAVSLTWSQLETQGSRPSARQCHVIVAVDSKIYIHGGLAGDMFHDDMFSLDTGSMKWEKVATSGDIPPGVAAHSAVLLGKNIYIFGGMTEDGDSNSMYRFNTEKCQWVLLSFEGDLPPHRLDHSMCLLPWRVKDEERVDSLAASDPVNLAFVFGGMDTMGVLHNDCVVTMVS